ncbi:MAG: XRE family transcriptional regulator [Nocardia sp.]|nr:XRE family transcriptional regulator [Nocardia sp.]
MSRNEIARLADISAPTLSNWSSGKTHPTVDLLARVVRVLGIRITDVVITDPATRLFSDLRVAAGFTQPQLAGAAGMTTPTLQKIERGDVKQLLPRHVKALAKPLGVTDQELIRAWNNTRKRGPGVPA